MEISANNKEVIGQELRTGIRAHELLDLPVMRASRVLAGRSGLDRVINRVNVMEVPDVLPWVKPGELLLTTGFPLRRVPGGLSEWIAELDASGVSVLSIKFGRYLDELPPDALHMADVLGLPIISFPEDAGFDDVLNTVLERVLNHRASVLDRAEQLVHELVDTVVGGGGLSDVGEKLIEDVAECIMVTSPDGRILADVRGENVDLPANLACFDSTGRYKAEHEAVGTEYVERGWSRFAMNITGGGRPLGRVVAFARVMDAAEVAHMLHQASAAAAIVMTRDRAVATVESKYRSDFLRDALRGRAGTSPQVAAHARAYGWHLKRPLVVVVAERRGAEDVPDRQERASRDNFATAWQRAVAAVDSEAAVGAYSDEIVMLVGVDPADEHSVVSSKVARMARDVRGVGGGGRQPFTTGISRTFNDLVHLPKAYAEARKAVEVGARMHGVQSVVHFDSLGVFRLLSLIEDEAELDDFVRETLGELSEGAEEDVDLLTTLEALLDHGLNVAETARELHFHYNSLRYRIGKLERILGPFMTDPQRRFSVQVALAARQLLRDSERHRQDVT